MSTEIKHQIWDELTGINKDVTIRLHQHGVGIEIHGYGDFGSEGDSEIVYLDWFDNNLQMVIHNDIDNQDPVIVNLSGAKIDKSEPQEQPDDYPQ